MIAPLCQTIQEKLLALPVERLAPAERAHLRACPACAAFAQDVSASGALLSSVAREVKEQTPLPAELKNRVFSQLMDKITAEENCGTDFSPVVANHGRDARAAVAAFLQSLAGALMRLRWAAAACVLLALVTAAALHFWNQQPIGKLEFASGPTSLASANHEGPGQWTCQRGADLSTREGAAALFSLGNGVRVAMAGSTRLQVLEKEKLTLKSGSVWLSVTPGGKGFKVETPFARVQVTGTKFGVTVTDRETRVEVAEGSVAVIQEAKTGKVTAGLELAAAPGGISNPAVRKEGTSAPAWVSDLLAAEKRAQAGSYLPSIGNKK